MPKRQSLTPKQRRERFDALERFGCIACWIDRGTYAPAEIHHLKGHQWSGMGQKADDAHTIPLCPAHHRHGEDAYHQSPREFERRYGTQQQLLDIINEWLDRRAA